MSNFFTIFKTDLPLKSNPRIYLVNGLPTKKVQPLIEMLRRALLLAVISTFWPANTMMIGEDFK